ncbi:hypothetical protein [Aureivirga sp. CE67]|uniref:hypothetical protein n=1 Tax=Aureivirga sp. CE67 TaxID=1788983 RepID=UPI0018CB9382|nr:hypothetical protein [Aureivirga sp. CE67]
MKHYFKYKSFYINIDNENITFTDSGNWQEVRSIQEKKNKVQQTEKRSLFSRIFKVLGIIIYLLFSLIGLCFFVKSFIETGVELIVKDFKEVIIKQEFYIFSVLLLIFFINNLIVKKNKNYVQKIALLQKQISLNDISEILIQNKVVKIKTEEKEIELDKVSSKGIEIFLKIKADL